MESNNNLLKIKTLLETFFTTGLIYILINFHIPNTFITVCVAILIIFCILQILDNIDKINGYGKFNNNPSNHNNNHYHHNDYHHDYHDYHQNDNDYHNDYQQNDDITPDEPIEDTSDIIDDDNNDDDFPFDSPDDNYV